MSLIDVSDDNFEKISREKMKNLPKVAIIGTGWGIRVQVPAFRAAGFEVSAIWARKQKKAEKIAEELKIPFATSDYSKILTRAEVELICIASPPHLHAEMSIQGLNANKHVISEKPTALNSSEAFLMLQASKKNPNLLSIVDHELRFLPTLVRMRNLIRDGYCGRVIILEAKVSMGSLIRNNFNWWCEESMGGGALGALGSHVIDALTYLTDLRAYSVHGILKTCVTETEKINGFRHITGDDFCTFQLKYPKDIYAIVTLNTHMPGKYEQEITVIGTDGRLILRGAHLWGYKHGMQKEELILLGSEIAKLSPFVKGTEVLMRCLREAFENDDLHLLSQAASFEDGFYTQLVMDGIRKSNVNGNWISIQLSSYTKNN